MVLLELNVDEDVTRMSTRTNRPNVRLDRIRSLMEKPTQPKNSQLQFTCSIDDLAVKFDINFGDDDDGADSFNAEYVSTIKRATISISCVDTGSKTVTD